MTEYGHSVANSLFVFLTSRECRFVTRNKSGELRLHQTFHFSEGKEIADYLDNDDLTDEIFAQTVWVSTDSDFLLVPNAPYTGEEQTTLFSNTHSTSDKKVLYEPSETFYGVIYSVYKDIYSYIGPDAQASMQSAVSALISFSRQQMGSQSEPFQLEIIVHDTQSFYIGWNNGELCLCKKENGPVPEMAYHAANAMEHLNWKGDQAVCRIWGEPTGRLKEYLDPYWQRVSSKEVDLHPKLNTLEGAILCGL